MWWGMIHVNPDPWDRFRGSGRGSGRGKDMSRMIMSRMIHVQALSGLGDGYGDGTSQGSGLVGSGSEAYVISGHGIGDGYGRGIHHVCEDDLWAWEIKE